MNAAGDGGSRAASAALQKQGKAFMVAIYAAARSLRLYPLENETAQKALLELHRAAGRLLEGEGVIDLRIADDFIFINDARLRMDLSSYGALSYVIRLLTRQGIAEVEVGWAVEPAEWAPFISLLVRDEEEREEEDGRMAAYQRFQERLAEAPVTNIRTGAENMVDAEEAEERERHIAKEAAKKTYAQSVTVARQVLTDVRLGKAVNVRRVKRAVQAIVDQVLANEQMMFGMTTLRDFDEYTFTHCVNVCIFSIIIGQKLGFSKLQLYELGIGALFHDIGKQRVGAALINKPGKLTEEEWKRMQRHTTDGMLSLFSMHGFTEVPWRAMLMAYEHHMKTDLTGYPRNRRPRKPTLFSRIVAVADGFEAGTAKRAYQLVPTKPESVLQEMRDNPKRGFDPLLVKALINVTGIFPIGTVVILDTHELAVVVEANQDRTKLHQPTVRLVSDALGRPMTRPTIVDLSLVDPETGKPSRSIIKTTDPEKYGIRVADYFA